MVQGLEWLVKWSAAPAEADADARRTMALAVGIVVVVVVPVVAAAVTVTVSSVARGSARPREPVRKSNGESGEPDNSSLSPFSARTWPCWLKRAIMDHNATPSSRGRVDGVLGMIQPRAEKRRDNLIYALTRTSC